MNLKHRIIKFLIEHKGEEFSIREISLKLKVDYKNTYDAIQQIKESININKKSNSSFISFKPKLTKEVLLTELERQEEIVKKLPLLYKDVQDMENPFVIPIIFGSYAKGTNTKNSDIDICLIHDNEKEIINMKRKLSIHPKLEIHDFTYNEFINMIKINDFSIGKEIVKFGIPLKNIETYYEVIRHG